MTDLLSRPILRVPRTAPGPERPVALVAAVGAAGVAVSGLVLCIAVAAAGWFAADAGSFGQAMSVGTLGWLVGNGAGLRGGGVSVGAVPLGFVLLIGIALHHAGRWAARTSRVRSDSDVVLAGLAMAAAYAVPGFVVTAVVQVGGAHAPLARAAVALVVLPLVFGGSGLLRGSGISTRLVAKLPEEARAALHGGIVGALVLVAIGALLVGGSLVVHFGTAVTLAEGLHAGLVGGVVLALVGTALVPNAVLCAGSFVAGPGFTVGSGTQVSPTGVHLGLLPDVPLLAALPTSATSWWMPGLIVLPVVAGAVAGTVAVRRYPVFGVDRAALRGALAGLLGGAAFGLSTVLATGSLGPGRLREIGPDVLGTTVVCAVALMLGGAFAAVASRWLSGGLGRRRDEPVEPVDLEATQPIRVRPTGDQG